MVDAVLNNNSIKNFVTAFCSDCDFCSSSWVLAKYAAPRNDPIRKPKKKIRVVPRRHIFKSDYTLKRLKFKWIKF